MDYLIDEPGVMKVKDSLSAEVLMRRLAEILVADEVGIWDTAIEIERTAPPDLMDDMMRRKSRKQAKWRMEFAKSKKSALKEKGETTRSKPPFLVNSKQPLV